MSPPEKSFFALTAGDLMTPAVLTLPQGMRLPCAARFLRTQRVSGAPVVDPEGRCVGVLSTTDFMHWAERVNPAGGSARVHGHDGFGLEWEVIEVEELFHDEVRRYMTPDPVTVSPDAGLVGMARLMSGGHIHRLIVVDEAGRPVGIVTSTDVLAAVGRGDVARQPEGGQP